MRGRKLAALGLLLSGLAGHSANIIYLTTRTGGRPLALIKNYLEGISLIYLLLPPTPRTFTPPTPLTPPPPSELMGVSPMSDISSNKHLKFNTPAIAVQPWLREEDPSITIAPCNV